MSEFSIGQVVQLNDGRFATVRYTEEVEFAEGQWIGVEMEDGDGKNDGSVKGVRYFDCEPGWGMFCRPAALTIIEKPPPPQPPKAVTAPPKKAVRPSSVVNTGGRRLSSVPDVGAPKRMSMNSGSPSPATRSRPSSMLRSPTKSPTKQLSATSTPRTGTPSNSRAPSVTVTKASRPSAGGTRTSMGPPPAPATSRRQSLAGGTGVGNRAAAPVTRSVSSRTSLAPKPRLRPGTERVVSIDSQISSGQASESSGHDTGDEGAASPVRSQGNFSPKPVSPVLSRTSAAERQNASPVSARSATSTTAQRPVGTNTAASREIEDLKTKCRLMEKKRMEDRDKLKELEKLRGERDKFEGIIQKLQTKLQPQQQELRDLERKLKEAQESMESIDRLKEDYETDLEHARLDMFLAIEEKDTAFAELEAVKHRAEELALECEILTEENAELGGEMSAEEKTSKGWLQMERNNDRLKEALMRLRDMTQETESELKDKIKSLEADLRELGSIQEQYQSTKEKLDRSETNVAYLKEQLDNAEDAEEIVSELAEKGRKQLEEIEELKATIEDLESLRELNDEIEINHIEAEKEMQEEIDIKESIIIGHERKAAEQEATIGDMDYTLRKFREIVVTMQSDLEDMKASHTVTESESEQLSTRSSAIEALNLKLRDSVVKTQVKTIDLELRRLEAQEASDHLKIVQMFLPDVFEAEKDSVLALLLFKRVAFKANLLYGLVKERINGQPHVGHEDDIFAACDVLDKLVWVSAMCNRFTSAISHCSPAEFADFAKALNDLERPERYLNGWIDGLRRNELKERECAEELQRTMAVMSHMAENHISSSLANYADDMHMRTVVMQSHLDNSAAALTSVKTMVLTVVPSQGDQDELAQHFSRRTENIIALTRSAKVIVGKAVRDLEGLTSRSLSLSPDTIQSFEECEVAAQELAVFTRRIGDDLYALLHEEGRAEPFNYLEVQSCVHRTTTNVFASSESDLFSAYANKLRTLTTALSELQAMASDLEMTQEFERSTEPWILRSQELKSSKTVHVDTEEQLIRLKEESNERARQVKQRDQTLEEASVKIELLESRMRDATKKNERINDLERRIEEAKKQEAKLNEIIESRDKELVLTEADREKWKKTAEDNKTIGVVVPGSKAGQERAVATAREMEALKNEIASLEAAVRYLREDNRRARLTDTQSFAWLDAPLTTPKSQEQRRKDLVVAEATDVLNELLNLTTSAKVFDLTTLPEDRLAWRPAKATPQYHVAKQRDGFAAWKCWRLDVERKGKVLVDRDANGGVGVQKRAAAKVQMKVVGWGNGLEREVEIYEPEEWEGFRRRLGVV